MLKLQRDLFKQYRVLLHVHLSFSQCRILPQVEGSYREDCVSPNVAEKNRATTLAQRCFAAILFLSADVSDFLHLLVQEMSVLNRNFVVDYWGHGKSYESLPVLIVECTFKTSTGCSFTSFRPFSDSDAGVSFLGTQLKQSNYYAFRTELDFRFGPKINP